MKFPRNKYNCTHRLLIPAQKLKLSFYPEKFLMTVFNHQFESYNYNCTILYTFSTANSIFELHKL